MSIFKLHFFGRVRFKNRAYFNKLLNSLNKEVDIILLPEIFRSGFTINAKKVFETMDGPKNIDVLKQDIR